MVKRRDFLAGAGGIAAASGYLSGGSSLRAHTVEEAGRSTEPSGAVADRAHSRGAYTSGNHVFNGSYQGEALNQIAFPLGGMGAGMVCVDGQGGLCQFSLQHGQPDLEREHVVFAALAIKGREPYARVLQGIVPDWRLRPQFPAPQGGGTRGLPRFHEAVFTAHFPFATVELRDSEVPLQVTLTAWSPFSAGDADNASLPVAGLEYQFTNTGADTVDAVFSFNAENFMGEPFSWLPETSVIPTDRIKSIPRGFLLCGSGENHQPWQEGAFAAWVDDVDARINHAWPLAYLDVLWKYISAGEIPANDPVNDSAAGGSIFVPFTLQPGQSRQIRLSLAWYVPHSNLYAPERGILNGKEVSYTPPADRYRPWYATRFGNIEAVIEYWNSQYGGLHRASQLFSRTLHDTTLPPEAVEAVVANLSILKSTTVLRQHDGKLWGWEGTVMASGDAERTGVSGTTTHVWNYAQAIPHLFPELERGLRETELNANQNAEGLQYCRTPLPIRPVEAGHVMPDGPAADGQLGGIIKIYREWRISGDTQWLKQVWPKARLSLDYCIKTYDPNHRGCIEEPHLTTYDAEFWGADSLCGSLYVGALKAAVLINQALQHSPVPYEALLEKGLQHLETTLFNGEYFIQKIQWKNLQTLFLPENDTLREMYTRTPEWRAFAQSEGPIGQYGNGCLSDGVMGIWLSQLSGIEPGLDPRKVSSHLEAVHRYNLKKDLTGHANFLRANFACGQESGLVLCSWPEGGRPTLPMIYSDEVWTGIEYQVACHLISTGKVDAGLDIVRAVRRRYDGRVRNPFAEVEAGHWYARAMSSYALLQALGGARYDAVDRVLHLQPAIRGDYRCFLATATGYGTVGVKNGKPFVEVAMGTIPYRKIEFRAALGALG